MLMDTVKSILFLVGASGAFIYGGKAICEPDPGHTQYDPVLHCDGVDVLWDCALNQKKTAEASAAAV